MTTIRKQKIKVEVPEEIKKAVRGNDYVSFTAGSTSSSGAACFGSIMSYLGQKSRFAEIVCSPNGASSPLPADIFSKFFEIGRNMRIVPPEAELIIKGGKCLVKIPNLGKGIVYPALCWYRWADTNPAFAYEFVELCGRLKKISPWQVLHYVMSRRIGNTGHNFTNINSSGNEWKNPGHSVAARFYFREQNDKARANLGGNYMNTTIAQLVKDLVRGERKASKFGIRDFHPIKDLEKKYHILRPYWTPLFSEDLDTAAKVAEISSKAFEAYKEELAAAKEAKKEEEKAK